mgnify:CR=1 FL=1
MTEEQIGKTVKDILSHDNTAEVKRNGNGDIIILEVKKKIAKEAVSLKK